MKFSILGSLEAVGEDGPVALGGSKPRSVLAYLLLHPNEPVSSERLAVALWGEDAPSTATKTVQVHVSRLRKALGDADQLTTTAAGYRLSVDPGDLDAERFARLVEDGRRALAGEDHHQAGTILRKALDLWRGPALADLAFEPFAQTEITRLEEQRLAALEIRIEADLGLGRHTALVGELLQLVAANPSRERLTGQLMLALYRCARQSEALDAFTRLRAYQAGELGLEPGPEVRDLQARILEQSPTLDLAAAPAPAPAPARLPWDLPPPPAQALPPAAGAGKPIVGREAELDELTAALEDARDGRGSLFLLLGDAGIGKTRLAEAVVDAARERDYDVLWASSWESGGAAAYWPWRQAIRQLLDARAPEDSVADVGEGAPFLVQMIPEAGRRLATPADPLPTLESEAARFGAFDAVASFLFAAAARWPILLVIDDLHAADIASVRLLELVARGLRTAPMVVIATQRTDTAPPDDEVQRALADVSQLARRLEITGLPREDVLALAAAQSPNELSDDLVDRVHDLTNGNPLFVDEVMRLLTSQGVLATPEVAAGDRLAVPVAVRETIGRRLEPLNPPVVEALTAAAVIGSQFRLQTLAAVVDREPATLLAYLDAAIGAGLVQELPGALGSYRFAHGLARETLYDELGGHDRAALHGRVGEAMLAIYGDGPDAPLSELAHHFIAAAPLGDVGRAATYATRAGEHALELMAHEQAIELFGEGLRALELGPARPERRGPILLALGQAEMRAGRLDASRGTLRKAAADARLAGDAELFARAALASAPLGLATGLADEEGMIPAFEEALERLPTEDSELRAQLLARRAAALYWSSSAQDREFFVDDAIAMARRVGDPATLAFVLSDAHRATWDPDSPDRSMGWASEIYAVAERLGNMELALIAHSWRISLLLELGEMTIVHREMEIFQRAAARLHQQRALAQGLLHRCAREIMVGRFAEAEALLGEAAGYATLLAQDPFLSMRLGALAFVMREVQGRLGELEAAVRHFADSNPAMPVWRCGLLSVYLQEGREDDLRRDYARLVAGGVDALPRDNLWLPAMALLSEACAHLGDRTTAPALRSLLEPYAGRNVVTPDVAYIGPVDRYLALLAATEEDGERAEAWFASAREFAERMGARPTIARLGVDEARWLADRDPARAAGLAAAAAAEADALGLERLATLARSLAGGSSAV